MRRVVDDEVDAGEVLESTDVATLAPNDPALHVVGGELHDRHRGLGRVARSDPLQSVGDQVPGATLRLGARLVFESADPAGEFVTSLLLPALEQQCPRVSLRQAGDPLKLREVGVPRLLEFLLEVPDVLLPVCKALLAPRKSLKLSLDLEFLREDTLLDLQHLGAPVC